MRLTTSLLTAVALHAVLFGVAAAVLSRQTIARPAPVTVEVEVIEAQPDPVAEASAVAAGAATKRTAPLKPRTNLHHHEVALVSDSATAEPTVASDTPALSAVSAGVPATAAPAGSLVPARSSAAPSGSAIVAANPRYRTNPKPDYPLPCKRRREEGIVLLSVVVQPDGLPSAISLNRSSGHPLLDRAALDAVRRWTFEPGRAAGVPVLSVVVVPVRFTLSEQP